LRIVEGFCIRDLMGETIAVPTEAAAKQFSGLLTLNEVGAFLFQFLQEECTRADLLAALTNEYEVERSVAEADIDVFLDCLRAAELLVEEEGG